MVEIPDVIRGTMVDGLSEGQIEITVEKPSIPGHTDLISAHQFLDRPLVKGIVKEP